MHLPVEFRKLTNTHVSDNFVLHYQPRNPNQNGLGSGSSGVKNKRIVTRYAAALERAYAHLKVTLNWESPRTHERYDSRIPVFVCDPSKVFPDPDPAPFTYLSRLNVSFVVLPSESDEPTSNSLRLKAEAEAAHEAVHVFTHRHHPPKVLVPGGVDDPWKWFDEATAVFLEREILGSNRDHIRYALLWSHCPELSLADPDSGYKSAWFVMFLVKKFGHELLRKIWHESNGAATPIEAIIEALSPLKQQFAVTDPNVRDVFTDYCIESWDDTSFAFDVKQRFGPRSLAASVVIRGGQAKPLNDDLELQPLACRYLRIVPRQASSLRVRVDLSGSQGRIAAVKAALIEIDSTKSIGTPRFLTRPLGADNSLAIETPISNVDYYILLVANLHCPTADVFYDPSRAGDFRFRTIVEAGR